MQEISKAICATILEIKGVEKNSTVGTGSYGYKGVSDKDVKRIIGQTMARNGLSILQTGLIVKNDVARTLTDGKAKMSVFLEVETTYLLLHTSGESIEIKGYGHATDNADKAPGKAMTYALKYALLYTFLVPTGDIDDTDSVHSNDVKVEAVDYKKMLSKELYDKFGYGTDVLKQYFKATGGCTQEQAATYLNQLSILGDQIAVFLDPELGK